jgi:hypothetical protein
MRNQKFHLTLFLPLLFCCAIIHPLGAQECPEFKASSKPLTVISKPFPEQGLTLTNFNLGWLENGGSNFFEIYVDPGLADVAEQGRLWLAIDLIGTVIGGNQEFVTLKKDKFPLERQHVGRVVQSNELFGISSIGQGYNYDFLDELSDKNGKLLPTRLSAEFVITCDSKYTNTSQNDWEIEDFGRIDGSFGGTIDPTIQNIAAISPGVKNPQAAVDILDQLPIFHFNSRLASSGIKYKTGDVKFAIYLVELRDGESAMDIIENASVPLLAIREGEPATSAPYPLDKPPLKPGATYGWKIGMRLRGLVDRWVYSDPLFFRVVDNSSNLITRDVFPANKEVEGFVAVGDNYSKRLLAALKIILEDNYHVFIATLGDKAPIKGQIRWNGQPYSLEQLEKLARSFVKKNHTLTRMRFR